MRDKITLSVEPDTPSGKLDVADAFAQILDLLQLVEFAAGDGSPFQWKLDRASTNSPFTVTAQVPWHGRGSAETLAAAQRRAEDGLRHLARGDVVPWMGKPERVVARRIVDRFQGKLGKLTMRPGPSAKRAFVFLERDANAARDTLRRVDALEDAPIPPHRGYGEIEGVLLEASFYRGKPALIIQTAAYQAVRCIVSDAASKGLGSEATIREVWQKKRVQVVGTLHFAEGGSLDRVDADSIRLFPGQQIDVSQILDSDFTGGLEPPEYLRSLYGGGVN